MPVIGQKPVKRTFPEPVTNDLPGILETPLHLCPAQRP